MLKQRLVALFAGIALIIAVAGTAAGVSNAVVDTMAPDAPAIACSGQSGGGC